MLLQRYAAKLKRHYCVQKSAFKRVRTSLLFTDPPPLDETALASRTASLARVLTIQIGISPLAVALSARGATGRADAALDRARGRPDGRAVVVRVGIRGAGARGEERVWWRTGVAPGPRTRAAWEAARVFGSAGAGRVVADSVVDGCRARGARAEEVDGAA